VKRPPTIVLKFAKECGNDLLSYKRIFRDYEKALNQPGSEVLFECGDAHFFRPLGLNILASLIRSFLDDQPRKIFFTPPNNDDCKKYLQSQGFYEEFNLQEESRELSLQTTLPYSTSVRLYRNKLYEPTYFERIAKWLNKNLQYAENEIQAIEDILSITLSEIFNNVIDHSQSPIGYYVNAQAYRREKCLMLSVVDTGIGFHATLARRYKFLANNEAAIAHAIQYGVSSRSKHGNAGAGLDILADAMKNHAGHLEIVSKDGLWRQQPDGSRSGGTLPFSFPGTCINVQLDNTGILR